MSVISSTESRMNSTAVDRGSEPRSPSPLPVPNSVAVCCTDTSSTLFSNAPVTSATVDTFKAIKHRSRLALDVDGMRCEVLSMRSVPYALYGTPPVWHVIALYVRQLIDDFTGSLLLCRRSPPIRGSRSHTNPGNGDSKRESGGAGRASSGERQPTVSDAASVTTATFSGALATEDEETYLILRLCALEEKGRHGAKSCSPDDRSLTLEHGHSTSVRKDDQDGNDGVTEQLVALFAAAERERQQRLSSSTCQDPPSKFSGAPITPPLLSSRLQFKPMLRDLQFLADHLLLPRQAWLHHQRAWVILHEDVIVTLHDRVARYRSVAIRRTRRYLKAAAAEGTDAHCPTTEMGDDSLPFHKEELEQLWHCLWELLGAAWRQRDRLWGAYRHLHGSHRLPPLILSGEATSALPPSVHASAATRAAFARYTARRNAATLSSSAHSGLCGAIVESYVEDSCAFGPFTSAEVGISSQRSYVLRQPLNAVLRSLRVSAPLNGRDPLVTSTSAFAGFTYVTEPTRHSPSADSEKGTSPLPSSASLAANVNEGIVVPLFDATDAERRLEHAIPYLSPEVYLAVQRRRELAASKNFLVSSPLPVHTFSDDVWNAAVIVFEAALSGFDVRDDRYCHLASPPQKEQDSANFAVQNQKTSLALLPTTSSVYVDVVSSLTHQHRLPKAAAHNFLYATLFHLQALLRSGNSAKKDRKDGVHSDDLRGGQNTTSGVGCTTAILPSPLHLADDWIRFLSLTYGEAFVRGLLTEVAVCGLCWSRADRWSAFELAHTTSHTAGAPGGDDSVDTAAGQEEKNSIATLCTPLTMRSGIVGRAGDREDELMPNPVAEPAMTGSEAPLSRRAADDDTIVDVTDARAGGIRNKSRQAQPVEVGSHSSRGVTSPLRLMCLSSASQLGGVGSGRDEAASSFNAAFVAPSPSISRSSSLLGLADGNSAASALLRPPTRLERTFNTLDTPLLPLFELRGLLTKTVACKEGNRCGASEMKNSADDGAGFWEKLSCYLRRCTTTTVGGASTEPNFPSLAVGRANGTFGEAADADSIDVLLHLCFQCLFRMLRYRAADEGGDNEHGVSSSDIGQRSAERCYYAALRHPFFQGLVERDLLTTYTTVMGGDFISARAEAPRCPAWGLPTLNLYLPITALLDTIQERETTWKGKPVPHRSSSFDSAAIGAVKLTSSLRMIIGDDMRAWAFDTDVTDKANLLSPSWDQQPLIVYSHEQVSSLELLRLPEATHRARHALDAALTPLDLNLASQLHHARQLRGLIYGVHTVSPAGDAHRKEGARARGEHGGKTREELPVNYGVRYLSLPVGSAAQRVRQYLKGQEASFTGACLEDPAALASLPVFPIPSVLRGEVWGCLLGVPQTARAREALLIDAVHQTAARPTLHDRQLSIDIPRCHAYHPLLRTASGSAKLQRILKAWLYRHPKCPYWQGLDSVCAVLLTVTDRDEALVLATLDAVVERFIVQDDDGGGASGRDTSNAGRTTASMASLGRAPLKPTMGEQLLRLGVALRYCDPLLAHHLFDVVGCTPELYAISWLLTLFSHTLPTRKVYLLWDFLFVEGDIGALIALCTAVVMHRREQLLCSDFSSCLAIFSSGKFALNVKAAVKDARQLVSALPPSVLAPSLSPSAPRGVHRKHSASHDQRRDNDSLEYLDSRSAPCFSEAATSDPVDMSLVSHLSVEDLASAFAAEDKTGRTGCRWFNSGVYLIDLRDTSMSRGCPGAAVLGAINVPLITPTLTHPTGLADKGASSQRAGKLLGYSEDLEEDGGAEAGWGVVKQQERLYKRQQASHEALRRRIDDAAAAIVRYVDHPAIAAVAPRTSAQHCTLDTGSRSGDSAHPASSLSRWPVQPIVRKATLAPHVVLLPHGSVDSAELAIAHQLGVKLSAHGLHHVSILRGGVESIRRALPELLVPRTPSP